MQNNARPALAPEVVRHLARGLAGLLLIIFTMLLFGGLALRVGRYLSGVWPAITYPFELDYGEGGVWQQAVLIPSSTMYGRIDTFPFIVFEYPPLYHLAVRGLMALGVDPLTGGRALSFACTLAIVGLCGWLVNRAMAGTVGRWPRLVGVWIAILIPLTCYPVAIWSMLMRVDMLAVALSFAGVAFAVMAVRRPVWLWPTMLMFVFAVYTRQTEIIAPVAALAVSAVINPRQTLLAVLGGLAMAIAILLSLEWETSGGFLRHILLYNVSPFSFRTAIDIIQWMYGFHLVYFAAALAGLPVIWWAEIRSAKRASRDALPTSGKQNGLSAFLSSSDRQIVLAIVTVWFFLSLPAQITVGRSGAWVNYFIELVCIWSIPIGMLVAFGLERSFRPVHSIKEGLVCGMTLLLLASLLWQTSIFLPDRDIPGPTVAAASRRLVEEVSNATQPVFSEDMVVLLRGGKTMPLEPAIFSHLSKRGVWDQSAFLRMIEDRGFAFLIIHEERRYTPEMLSAFRDAYPNIEQIGTFTVRRPLTP
jgi:hypothetical protein